MARCFPFPPRVSEVRFAVETAEPIKLLNEKEMMAYKELRKDRKVEKKEKDKSKKSKKDKSNRRDSLCKTKNGEDSSGLTLEHEQPVRVLRIGSGGGNISDESSAGTPVSSLKRKKPEPSFISSQRSNKDNPLPGNLLRIKLPYVKPKVQVAPRNEQDPCCSQSWNKLNELASGIVPSRGKVQQTLPPRAKVQQILEHSKVSKSDVNSQTLPRAQVQPVPVLRKSADNKSRTLSRAQVQPVPVLRKSGDNNSQTLPSAQVQPVHENPKLRKSDEKNRILSIEAQEKFYQDLIVNWKPPVFQAEDSEEDDMDWLFKTKERQPCKSEANKKCTADDIGSVPLQTSILEYQTRARFLPEVNIYAMPYVVPF